MFLKSGSLQKEHFVTYYKTFISWWTFPGSFITANLYDIFAASLFRENITLLSQINQISLHRLKKIQEKKKVLKEKSEKERELRRAAGGEQEPANLLAEEKDEDLLFE